MSKGNHFKGSLRIATLVELKRNTQHQPPKTRHESAALMNSLVPIASSDDSVSFSTYPRARRGVYQGAHSAVFGAPFLSAVDDRQRRRRRGRDGGASNFGERRDALSKRCCHGLPEFASRGCARWRLRPQSRGSSAPACRTSLRATPATCAFVLEGAALAEDLPSEARGQSTEPIVLGTRQGEFVSARPTGFYQPAVIADYPAKHGAHLRPRPQRPGHACRGARSTGCSFGKPIFGGSGQAVLEPNLAIAPW